MYGFRGFGFGVHRGLGLGFKVYKGAGFRIQGLGLGV